MAYGMIRQVPDALTFKDQPVSLGQTVSKACIVTWMNPQAILDGTMLLGAFRITLPAAEATTFLTGVLLASGLWFLSLTAASPPSAMPLRPASARHQRPLRHGPHAVRPPFSYTFVQFSQI